MSVKTTSAQSRDTLPLVGYTHDQLKDYIFRQLGAPGWEIELTTQHVLDAIQDAQGMYSIWRPALRYGSVKLSTGINEYLKGTDLGFGGMPGLGIVQVWFVEPNPVPTEIFYGNLIDPAPLFRTGVDEYDTFLRWRKTWARVTSVQPDWLYDEVRQCLYIHNPVSRYHAGIVAYAMWPLERLNAYGADWVKRYSLAKAKLTYGEILSKFSGALPGPVKDLQLDTSKREKAEAEIEKLEATLKASQEFAPIQID
jgi:hypothetical protein